MGLILDSSLLIADEREDFSLATWLRSRPPEPTAVSAITFSELWFGIEVEENAARARRRRRWLEKVFGRLEIVPLDARIARVHAQLWAQMSRTGHAIGAHDLIIAATGLRVVEPWPVPEPSSLDALKPLRRVGAGEVSNSSSNLLARMEGQLGDHCQLHTYGYCCLHFVWITFLVKPGHRLDHFFQSMFSREVKRLPGCQCHHFRNRGAGGDPSNFPVARRAQVTHGRQSHNDFSALNFLWEIERDFVAAR